MLTRVIPQTGSTVARNTADFGGGGIYNSAGTLTLRAGIATGYALLFEGDDYIGSAVNMASRLCDIAGPFEVLLPTDVVAAAAHVGCPKPLALTPAVMS